MATSAPPAPNAPCATEPVAARTRDRERAVVAAILLASFVLYAPSLANDFAWDDRHAAMGSGPTRNPLVGALHPLGDYFASNWWPQRAPAATAYRPLTTLWFALRHAVCGDHAVVAHLANVLLHTLAVGLVYRLLRGLGAPFAAAAAGTAMFGLHALHSEAVANVVGAAELLALACGLGATLSLLRAADAVRTRAFAGWLAMSAVCWLAAASAKESGLAWTAFAPLCLLARGALLRGARRPTAPRLAAIAAAATAAAACYLLLRANMIARLPGGGDTTIGLLDNPLLRLPALERAASGVLAWGHGLLQVLLPRSLCCDHGPDQLPVVRDAASALGAASACVAAAFAGAVAAALLGARRAPLAALAVACFVVFSFLLTNVPMPVFAHFAERNYTTPSLALALAAAAVAARLRSARARRIGAAALAAWLLWSVAVAAPRNLAWADDATLIERDVASSPRSVRLQLCAGALQLQRGDLTGAHLRFERAAALAPELVQPWLELARLASRRGDVAAMRGCVERAEHADPHEVARHAGVLRAARARLDALAAPPPPPPPAPMPR